MDIEISRNFPFFVASLFVYIAWFERQTKPVFFFEQNFTENNAIPDGLNNRFNFFGIGTGGAE